MECAAGTLKPPPCLRDGEPASISAGHQLEHFPRDTLRVLGVTRLEVGFGESRKGVGEAAVAVRDGLLGVANAFGAVGGRQPLRELEVAGALVPRLRILWAQHLAQAFFMGGGPWTTSRGLRVTLQWGKGWTPVVSAPTLRA